MNCRATPACTRSGKQTPAAAPGSCGVQRGGLTLHHASTDPPAHQSCAEIHTAVSPRARGPAPRAGVCPGRGSLHRSRTPPALRCRSPAPSPGRCSCCLPAPVPGRAAALARSPGSNRTSLRAAHHRRGEGETRCHPILPSCARGSRHAASNPAESGAASNQPLGDHGHRCSNERQPRGPLAHEAGGLLAPLRAPVSCPRPSPGPGKKGPFSLQSPRAHGWMQLSSFTALETDIAPGAVAQPPPALAQPHASGGQSAPHVLCVMSETRSNVTVGIRAGPTNSCPVEHTIV